MSTLTRTNRRAQSTTGRASILMALGPRLIRLTPDGWAQRVTTERQRIVQVPA